MTTTIDKFGRVLIPKKMRDAMGLEAGAELEVEQTDEQILIKPKREGARWVVREGVTVYVGAKAVGDMTHVVEDMRNERIRQLGGQPD